MDCVLRIIGLGKRFGDRWAVKGIDLEVYRGDIFCFLGPNGAGKSTTIRLILTLLRPTQGRIEIFGIDPHRDRHAALCRVGGIVEKPDFYPYLSAYRNLEIIGAMTRPLKRKEIMDALARVGLVARAFDKVRTYSHGMKQRLGIAQALLTRPELIILDEPTTGLDPQGMKEVRGLIQRLSHEEGITIFLSSHLLSEIEQIGTRMAVIHRGEVVIQGGVAELLAAEAKYYLLKASPPDKAISILHPLPWVEFLSAGDAGIEIRLEPDRAAELMKILIKSGIDISCLYPRRTLEDFFLKVTQGVSDI